MEFFRSIGFPEYQLLHFLTLNPNVLLLRLEEKLIPAFDFLKSILVSNERVINAIRRGNWILTSNTSNKLIPNIKFFRSIGVSASNIALLLINHPDTLLVKPAHLCKYADELTELGFDVSKSMFVLGLNVVCQKTMRSIRERCIEAYKRLGWSDDDISSAFRKYPQCLCVSEKKIMKIMNFLVNKMGCQPKEIAKFPIALCSNFERRIVSRCAVVHVLLSKGLLKRDWRLSCVLMPSEEKFLMKFVFKFSEQAPELLNVYEEKMNVSKD